jgi:hypothetical protein
MGPHISFHAEESARHPFVPPLRAAFDAAARGEGKLSDFVLGLRGMSGRKYRQFINLLIGTIPDPRYLEIGVWAGSTLCSAIANNAVTVTAVDNWSQFGGPTNVFLQNLSQVSHPGAHVSFFERDYRQIRFDAIGKFNVYLYDGPHEAKDQYDGIALAQPALENDFVLIVDDWNWEAVREGTQRAFEELGLDIAARIEVRTTLDGSHSAESGAASDWHNGYCIAAISKPSSAH